MTIIIADTTSGLPIQLAQSLDIPLIPQLVIIGEQTYRDDTEMTPIEFLKRLKSSPILPKTAAPPPTLYAPIFEKARQASESVIVIAPTAKMSGTFRSAEVARQDFPDVDIRIIDTNSIAGCLGTLVLEAHRLALLKKSPDEIEAAIRLLMPRARTYFIVDTLEYLQKGGRIGAARAILGQLLQVKPILQIKDGMAASFDQERTKKRAVARLINQVCETIRNTPDPRLCLMHIAAEEEALAMQAEFKERLQITEIPLYTLPPAIIVHAGPKALAVGFFE